MSTISREFKHSTEPGLSAVVQYGWGSDQTTVSVKRGDTISVIPVCADSDIVCLWCGKTLYIVGSLLQPLKTEVPDVHLVGWQQTRWGVSKIRCICVSEARGTLICIRDGKLDINYRPKAGRLQAYGDGSWKTVAKIPYGHWDTIVETTRGVLTLSDRKLESGSEINTEVQALSYDMAADKWSAVAAAAAADTTATVTSISLSVDIMKPRVKYDSCCQPNALSCATEWLH